MAGGERNFELDHFKPKSIPSFAELVNDFYNLHYSCHVCNQRKAAKWPSEHEEAEGYRFIDPCNEDFSEHFHAESDGTWTPLSPAAEYTAKRLQLNNVHLTRLRSMLQLYAMKHTHVHPDWGTAGYSTVEALFDPP